MPPGAPFLSRFCSVMTAWVVSMMPAMEQALMRPLRVTCGAEGLMCRGRKGWGGERGAGHSLHSRRSAQHHKSTPLESSTP